MSLRRAGEYIWHPARIYITLTEPFDEETVTFRNCQDHWLSIRLLTRGVIIAT